MPDVRQVAVDHRRHDQHHAAVYPFDKGTGENHDPDDKQHRHAKPEQLRAPEARRLLDPGQCVHIHFLIYRPVLAVTIL